MLDSPGQRQTSYSEIQIDTEISYVFGSYIAVWLLQLGLLL